MKTIFKTEGVCLQTEAIAPWEREAAVRRPNSAYTVFVIINDLAGATPVRINSDEASSAAFFDWTIEVAVLSVRLFPTLFKRLESGYYRIRLKLYLPHLKQIQSECSAELFLRNLE